MNWPNSAEEAAGRWLKNNGEMVRYDMTVMRRIWQVCLLGKYEQLLHKRWEKCSAPPSKFISNMLTEHVLNHFDCRTHI